MKHSTIPDEQGTAGDLKVKYILRLFVAGNEQKSQAARENLAQICKEYLEDNCNIEIIDVLKDFKPALESKIFVTPALVLVSPLPCVTIFGSLSDKIKVLVALNLKVNSE